jgi:hypothetical protein
MKRTITTAPIIQMMLFLSISYASQALRRAGEGSPAWHLAEDKANRGGPITLFKPGQPYNCCRRRRFRARRPGMRPPTTIRASDGSELIACALFLGGQSAKGTAMAQQTGVMTGKPLIESDRIEGTTVYDPSGNNIGSIKRLMI